jgi:ApaG protein
MTDDSYKIDIEVDTRYLEEHSEPEEERYVFSYTITLINSGKEAAKLLTRRWLITDAVGKTQEVFGEGVVGEQPYLSPGEVYQYSSGTILNTPFGTMEGSYQMVCDDGFHFDASIPMFSLVTPNSLN